jgi:hypothetical protein
VRDWLELHRAIGTEDARGMAAASRRLLDSPPAGSRELLPYALAAHMTGLILDGRGGAALSAFVGYRRQIVVPPGWQSVFRFLVGQTVGPVIPPASG